MKTIFSVLFLILSISYVQAQTQLYLEIPGIDGESTRSNFEDQIIIDSYTFTVSSPKSKIPTGRVRSVVQFSGLTISKKADIATNPLMNALTKGQRLDRITLRLVSSVGGQGSQAYLTYTLNNIIVSDYKVEGNTEDSKPREEWLFDFESIESVYTRVERDGSARETNEFRYSLKSGI